MLLLLLCGSPIQRALWYECPLPFVVVVVLLLLSLRSQSVLLLSIVCVLPQPFTEAFVFDRWCGVLSFSVEQRVVFGGVFVGGVVVWFI